MYHSKYKIFILSVSIWLLSFLIRIFFIEMPDIETPISSDQFKSELIKPYNC
jgi:hypothetical protein